MELLDNQSFETMGFVVAFLEARFAANWQVA